MPPGSTADAIRSLFRPGLRSRRVRVSADLPPPDHPVLHVLHTHLCLFENAANPNSTLAISPGVLLPRRVLRSLASSNLTLSPHPRYFLAPNASAFPSFRRHPSPPPPFAGLVARAIPLYITGDRSLLARARPFRRLAASLLAAHALLLLARLRLSRGPLPDSSLSRAGAATVRWRGRTLCVTCAHALLPDLHLCVRATVRQTDEHLHDTHVFGVHALSPWTAYDADNRAEVEIPVRVGATTVSLRMRSHAAISHAADCLADFTSLFMQSILSELLLDATLPAMRAYIRDVISRWDVACFLFYCEHDGEIELVLKEDTTAGEFCMSPDEVRRSPVTHVLATPPIATQGRFRYLVLRWRAGELAFVNVFAVHIDKIVMPCVANFFERFPGLMLSLAYLIMLREDRGATCRSFLRMLRSSHAFSVVERARATGDVVLARGDLSSLADALEPAERAVCAQALRELEMRGVPFAQLRFRAETRWLAVSGRCEYDPVYEDEIVCLLYEDVSNGYRIEAQLRESIADMRLASEMLELHQYASAEELVASMHPRDVAKFRALAEGETATVRIRNTSERPKWLWFKAVCTSADSRGLLLSVQELTSLQSEFRATRSCFRVGSAGTTLGCWAVMLDGKEHMVFETKSFAYMRNLVDPQFGDGIDIADLRRITGPVTLELKMRLLDGQPYEWYSVTIVPAADGALLFFAFNINKRKITHDLLRQTQEMLDLAFAYSDVRLWSFEDTHRAELAILTIDSEFANEIDMDWSTLEHNVTAELQAFVTAAFRKALAENSELEIEVPFFFDTVHWLLLRGFPVEGEGHRRLMGIYVDLTAIKEATAELARQKAAAENAMMAKSTFLANMTHEIRAPLNGIYGLLEILTDTSLSPEQIEITNTIQTSFMNLNELLNSILDLAKLESHRAIPLTVRFDPTEAVADLQDSLFCRRRTPGIAYHIITDPSDPVLYMGDPHCFIRVVTALVSNCVKFTQHGSIDITMRPDGNSGLLLVVSDNGVGISPARLQGIREHFLRDDTAMIYENSCVGVSLMLVTEIVRFCKATIAIDAEVGIGTAVTIVFPWPPVYYPYFPPRRPLVRAAVCSADRVHRQMLAAYTRFYGIDALLADDESALSDLDDRELILIECHDDARTFKWLRDTCGRSPAQNIVCIADQPSPASAEKVEILAKPLKPHLMRTYFTQVAFRRGQRPPQCLSAPPAALAARVLAVDDSRTNQIVIRQMLRKLGCSVAVASDGAEAVAAVQSERFDVVLMDQCMPVLSGPDAARRIRALGMTVPIVAMTASNLQEDAEACRAAGMDAFLSKPTTLKELAKVLTDVCRGRG
jgi:signal transduction histidine kinase/CheY-like chemotaxis protein